MKHVLSLKVTDVHKKEVDTLRIVLHCARITK